MNLTLIPVAAALGLFLGMLGLLELGRRLGVRRMERDGDAAREGMGAVEGAVFALMGLLVAFTFSGAAARLDTRRSQIVDEANAIGTAWLRLDLAPAAAQPALRHLFRRYLDARLAMYDKLPDIDAARAEWAVAQKLQNEIWSQAVSATRETPAPTAVLLLSALNQMIDITTVRTMATRIHPPLIIFLTLGVVALAGALLAGYGMAAAKTRSWFHMLAFAAIMAITVYVILDLEFPRFGLIRVDSFDQVMRELRQSMD